MLFLVLIFQNSLLPLFEPCFLHLCRTFLALMPHTQCTHEPTHTSLSHSPGHPHTPTHPHTLLLKKGCSMSMLMCWQWFMLQREAVLLNPNSPGTERKVSSALTAVVLQHCYFLLSSHSSSTFLQHSQSCKFHPDLIHFSTCPSKTCRRERAFVWDLLLPWDNALSGSHF